MIKTGFYVKPLLLLNKYMKNYLLIDFMYLNIKLTRLKKMMLLTSNNLEMYIAIRSDLSSLYYSILFFLILKRMYFSEQVV